MAVDPIIQLKCSCNQYPWGKTGSDSLAARLCAATPGWDNDGSGTDFQICESKPYSEMWMGTYPALPSYTIPSGEDLQAVLDKYSDELIGRKVIDKFGHTKLPFLPKVLSFPKALPLQVHPDKALAAELHKKHPSDFTDPNHKPEIAIAVSKFEAFCGFKPLGTIYDLLQLDPLKKFLPQIDNGKLDNEALRDVVRAMLTADDKTIASTCEELRKLEKTSFNDDRYIPDLIPRLANDFDATDPGLLVALITMNYLVLQPGQGIYIPADGIHAYLSGDIIECMARSNNVINTGFCPKAERAEAELFCSSLTFTPHSGQECILSSEEYQGSGYGKTQIYSPPLKEFNMLVTDLGGGQKETLASVGGPSIILATRGGATLKAKGRVWDMKEGNVFFVAQGTEIELESIHGLLMHTAYVE